jgi:hypothetical protein
VHVCNLTFNELTHENVRIFTDCFRGAKNLPSLCLAPPTALDRRPRDCVCQIRNRSARRLRDDAVRFNEFRASLAFTAVVSLRANEKEISHGKMSWQTRETYSVWGQPARESFRSRLHRLVKWNGLPSRLIPHRHRPRAELQPAHELQVDRLR